MSNFNDLTNSLKQQLESVATVAEETSDSLDKVADSVDNVTETVSESKRIYRAVANPQSYVNPETIPKRWRDAKKVYGGTHFSSKKGAISYLEDEQYELMSMLATPNKSLKIKLEPNISLSNLKDSKHIKELFPEVKIPISANPDEVEKAYHSAMRKAGYDMVTYMTSTERKIAKKDSDGLIKYSTKTSSNPPEHVVLNDNILSAPENVPSYIRLPSHLKYKIKKKRNGLDN